MFLFTRRFARRILLVTHRLARRILFLTRRLARRMLLCTRRLARRMLLCTCRLARRILGLFTGRFARGYGMRLAHLYRCGSIWTFITATVCGYFTPLLLTLSSLALHMFFTGDVNWCRSTAEKNTSVLQNVFISSEVILAARQTDLRVTVTKPPPTTDNLRAVSVRRLVVVVVDRAKLLSHSVLQECRCAAEVLQAQAVLILLACDHQVLVLTVEPRAVRRLNLVAEAVVAIPCQTVNIVQTNEEILPVTFRKSSFVLVPCSVEVSLA